MNAPQGGVVIYAWDSQRVAKFYEHVAGLRGGGAAENYIILESGLFQLVVVRIPERIANQMTIESPPVRRKNGAIKPVFFVANLAQVREVAATYGGALNDAGREWSFAGATVCDGYDPEGNIFQLRQPQPAGR